MIMGDTEKVELLDTVFASPFTAGIGPWESQALEIRERVSGMEDFPLEDLMQT